MAERFDVIVRGARVLDPATDFDGIADIAIADGRIAAIGPALTRAAARELQAHGLYRDARSGRPAYPRVPGRLVLGHSPRPNRRRQRRHHVATPAPSRAYSIDAMRRRCRDYRINVRAFLHISGIGLTGCAGESVIDANLDTDAARAAITRHADFVCGVKVRMDRTSVGSNGLTPLAKAIEVAGDAGLPVMAHIGPAPPTAVEVTESSDRVTSSPIAGPHERAGNRTVAAIRHRRRRRSFDTSHNVGYFSTSVTEPAVSRSPSPNRWRRPVSGPTRYPPMSMSTASMARCTICRRP